MKLDIVTILSFIFFLCREGIIKPRSDFEQMTSQNNSNWSSWAVNTLVKNPLSWSVGRIKETILSPTATIDEKSEYIILRLVEVIRSFHKIMIF